MRMIWINWNSPSACDGVQHGWMHARTILPSGAEALIAAIYNEPFC